MADRLTRIAILKEDRCKPKKCRQECKKSCPVVKTGKLCIEVTSQSKVAYISEELCIGCGICVKKCPFDAIEIINLPKDLDKDTTHRYGANTFKLHRLPVPRPGQVLGLVGTNGIGKSTALKVLAGNYVIVVEHDLSVLDYLSDFICCLYGKPGAYGVVTLPFSVREGINIFLEGYVPTENLRFRDESLTFKVAETPQESAEEVETYARYRYPTMTKTQGGFKLKVAEGEFTDSQIIVMLGENGTGKTTFIRMLAGIQKPDTVEGSETEIPEFNVSYKPQKISPKFPNSVRHLLHQKIRDSYMHPQFVSDVMKPLQIEQLMDQEVVNLSGGELQRVALCLCLGKPADIYLIDEPSAYLDSEQRIVASKVIKRFILHAKKTAFVVEHDFIMATYLADRRLLVNPLPRPAEGVGVQLKGFHWLPEG
ncbi:hypothetical protein M8C21_022786 [Ambrosia artemisiifolia]|uniref:ABC transporter E family member 2-like protein n=1 Tax=Ambrosia artemisiifolia TaxID=4212 RepID=A0AAD5D345_AMBAR|nr:hypothetical protein M8C21_022786 [Ambrosia artemisiifolia]